MNDEPRFALFRDGRQVAKDHSTREAAIAEAYAQGVVVNRAADFPDDVEMRAVLETGYSIEEVPREASKP